MLDKKSFLAFFVFLLLVLLIEIYFLSYKKSQAKLLSYFVSLTSLTNPAIFTDTFSLRHKDLKNHDLLFGLHPALRERTIGTFSLGGYLYSQRRHSEKHK